MTCNREAKVAVLLYKLPYLEVIFLNTSYLSAFGFCKPIIYRPDVSYFKFFWRFCKTITYKQLKFWGASLHSEAAQKLKGRERLGWVSKNQRVNYRISALFVHFILFAPLNLLKFRKFPPPPIYCQPPPKLTKTR